MKTEVSNELILQAHKEACSKWKSIIEKECPELFNPKFKAGEWAIFDNRILKRINSLDYDGNGREADGRYIELNSSYYRHATKGEIETHLIKLAKEKGFNEGVSCYWALENITHNNLNGRFKYDSEYDYLAIGCYIIYRNGKWATIIEEPKVLTLEERVKQLEDKLNTK